MPLPRWTQSATVAEAGVVEVCGRSHCLGSRGNHRSERVKEAAEQAAEGLVKIVKRSGLGLLLAKQLGATLGAPCGAEMAGRLGRQSRRSREERSGRPLELGRV